MAKFVHLHGHTEYSLLDGLSKIQKLAKTAKDLEMDSLAITDHGVMYGAIEFYKACLDVGIKPIIGCELYVAPRSHKNKEGKMDTDPFHLTVLAKNYQGYLNLMKLVSISWLDGYYYRPRVDKELLEEFHEGLICLSGCPGGEFIKSLDEKDPKKAIEVAKSYLQIFGDGNYYLEVQNHLYKELLGASDLDNSVRQDLENMDRIQGLTHRRVKEISKRLGIPVVATNDYHYIKGDDAEAQDALVCIQTGKFLSDYNRLRMIDTPNLYLKSPAEMEELFTDMPEAVSQSVKIADMTNLEIPLGTAKFPVFQTPDEKSSIEYLRELTFERAKEKMELTKERMDRLEYELGVIDKKNYAAYFLVVQDFVNWAHQKGIITNTRGSAAGSLVLYALGVTNIDPIFYMLPFERFLNPFRPSLPDIDADMADDRRDEVIEYVSKKYGEDKVSHIVTFGTMMGRAAIRDIGRVLAIPYGEVDRIAKLVPPPHQGFHKALSDAIREVPELADLNRNDESVKRLLSLAMKVEGTVRHASVHAAGIVISPEPLTNFTPLQRETNGEKIVAQYDMFSIEEVGLVKMDFLGIRNLSILGRAVEYVKKNRDIDIDINNISLDDKNTYDHLAKGETMGLFQLEGSGMTRYLTELRPTSIFDIMAMIALYRPGPLSIIPEYIDRKHGKEKITYFDPKMKDYLERSLGLLVYQDDVLLTAINIAGYSWEEADKFRKAMGKKIPAEMAKQKDHFIQGCIGNGMEERKAEELFGLIEPFAAYGFNKAHAASYAMVAYQTAYMKANFPVEFMAAVMTAEYGDTDKIAAAINECKRLGIVVLPPDVNLSGIGFSLETVKDLSSEHLERQIVDVEGEKKKQAIRFGLSAIKNVGISAIESILQAREEELFSDLGDLCMRVDTRLVNRKTLESLIKAGALDSFGSRSALLIALDQVLDEAHKKNRGSNGQASLFDGLEEDSNPTFKLPEIDEMPLEQLLQFEKDLLGFYLHEPPYLSALNKLPEFTSLRISELTEESINQKLTIGGVIIEVKKVLTKKSGQEMAFVKIFDGSSELECVIFPKTFAENKDLLTKEQVVVLWGRIDKREDSFSLVVDSVEKFDEEESTPMKRQTEVEVEIPQRYSSDLLKEVNSTLRGYPGTTLVSVLIPDGDRFKKMPLKFTINPDTQLFEQLEKILGQGSIRLI